MMKKSGLRFVAGGVVAMLGGGCGLLIGYEDATLQPPDAGAGGATTGTSGSGGQGGEGAGGSSACKPGVAAPCYSGPNGTESVGSCKAGSKTCNAEGTAHGACMGDVTPGAETCADSADENCDGYDCGIWAELFGDSTDQYAQDVAIDSKGNTYIVGTFNGAIKFSSDAVISANSTDIFLVKFDSADRYVWSKQFGDTGIQKGNSIATDSAGNIIIGGFSAFTFSMGGFTIAAGAFVAKLTSAGEVIWTKGLGGGASGSVEAVAITPQDDIAITGFHFGAIDFGDGPISSQGATSDGFVAKLRGTDGSGKIGDGFWGKVFGDDQPQYPRSIQVDKAGNLLIVGDYFGSMDLGLGGLTSKGDADVFLAKLTPSGVPSWTKSFGDADIQHAYDLAVDPLGGPIITGTFKGTTNWGAGPIVAKGYDGFVFNYNSSGIYQWGTTFGDAADQEGRAVAVDSTGNVLLTGDFAGDVHFGVTPMSANGSGTNVFLAKFTGAGTSIWNKQFGMAGYQTPAAITTSIESDSVLVGRVTALIDFGTAPLVYGGGTDGFIARFGP